MSLQKICDWCGAPGEVIGTEKWLFLTIKIMGCTECHHEWVGDPTKNGRSSDSP